MSNYQKLDVWKESMLLVKEIYLTTKKFPKEELFGLTSQTKELLFQYHPISLKGWAGNIKRRLYGFCILPEVLFMSWKRC